MSEFALLPLAKALEVIGTTKAELQATAKLTDDEMSKINRAGADLDQAELIALSYGMHPSEIWGDSWVDAVLTYSDWQEGQ